MAVAFSIAGTAVDDHTTVLVVEGDLDLFTAPDLRERVNATIDDGCTNLVIDLVAASAVDSTALGVLIGALKRLRVREGDMVVVCDSPTIRHMLDITGLDEVFTVVPSRGEALESVAAGS
jgi:anti-sigma B factor antagonist